MKLNLLLGSITLLLMTYLSSYPATAETAQNALLSAQGGSEIAVSASTSGDKPLPDFPLRYRGSGFFQNLLDPSGSLVAEYVFDMERGVNREFASFIDREIEIFNVYDMDPSDGVDPDREYFIERNKQTGKLTCTLNEPALPNVFSRNWWLSNNMVYTGTEVVSGFEADCWSGAVPGIGIPVKLCSRADAYPKLALLLKKLGPFEFYDHYGVSLEDSNRPRPAFFRLPRVCRNL